MKIHYTLMALLLGVGLNFVGAQRIVPLMEQAELRAPVTKTSPQTKMECGTFDLPGVETVISGQSRTLRIDLDTIGLGSDLNDYRCIGCDDAQFGTVSLVSDTLIYTPNANVQQGFDTLSLQVCSPSGVCSEPETVIILAQRAPQTIQLGNQLVAPGARAEVILPDDQLPGGAVCRTLELCGDNYGGREQSSNFIQGFGQSNDIAYNAARYGGTDAVCVTLCNEFGLCDTYRATFTVNRASIQLPFFDDFSYDGFRPEVSLWQDQDVLINRSYGILPPSIGVATFDALDFDGRPYAASGNARTTLARDYLTSAPIDMTGKSGSVLSFYVQPKGLGNRPEKQDSFLVQFLSQTGNWNTVFGRPGRLDSEPNSFVNPFEGFLVPVPAGYLYDGFQFRFVNKSAEQGAVDIWNLDYVKLSDRSTTLVTNDLALMEEPFRLIEPYTSVPVRHLIAAGDALLADSIFLKVWNHRADQTPVNKSNFSVTNSGLPSFSVETSLIPSSTFGIANQVAPDTFEIRGAVFSEAPFYQQVRDFLFGLDPEQDYRINTNYNLTQVATEETTFAPGIVRNNRATQVTELADYFAYDDGSAESAIEGQEGNIIVQRYTAYVPDELIGIRIRIPRGLGGLGDQNIRFVIYGSDGNGQPDTEPLYEFDRPILYTEDFYGDSLQAFTSYDLPQTVELPVGDFFIGWEQLRADRSIPVGFDRNNQPEGVQFFDSGSGWRALTGSTRGAIMIRPLMSGADINPTDTDDPETVSFLEVFPNPTSDILNLRPLGNIPSGQISYRLFALNGAEVDRGIGRSEIDLSSLPSGIYLLECRLGDRLSRHKIVRR